MVKATPQPAGLFGGIADLSPTDQGILALCKRLQIEFARDGEPLIEMWVRLGMKLAFHQPELKPGRGRPKSDYIAPIDMEILRAAEGEVRELGITHDKALNGLVKTAEKDRVLPVAERTTHTKRIRRARSKRRRLLGEALLKWDT